MLAKRKTTSYKKKYPAKKRVKYPAKNNERVHAVKRNYDLGTIVCDSLSPTLAAVPFSLSSLPDYNDFVNLYDQYKICSARVRFYPKQTQVVHTSNGIDSIRAGRFLSCFDYNDTNPPASQDEVRQYETCKVTTKLDIHERYVPHLKYVTDSQNTTDDWCPTSNPTVRWLGLKYAIDPDGSSAGRNQEYVGEVTLYLCFKNIK